MITSVMRAAPHQCLGYKHEQLRERIMKLFAALDRSLTAYEVIDQLSYGRATSEHGSTANRDRAYAYYMKQSSQVIQDELDCLAAAGYLHKSMSRWHFLHRVDLARAKDSRFELTALAEKSMRKSVINLTNQRDEK